MNSNVTGITYGVLYDQVEYKEEPSEPLKIEAIEFGAGENETERYKIKMAAIRAFEAYAMEFDDTNIDLNEEGQEEMGVVLSKLEDLVDFFKKHGQQAVAIGDREVILGMYDEVSGCALRYTDGFMVPASRGAVPFVLRGNNQEFIIHFSPKGEGEDDYGAPTAINRISIKTEEGEYEEVKKEEESFNRIVLLFTRLMGHCVEKIKVNKNIHAEECKQELIGLIEAYRTTLRNQAHSDAVDAIVAG